MTSRKRIELRLERTIPAAPEELFDAWLDPTIPGNPWHAAERLLLDARVDGLFYWSLKGMAHYGRFTAMDRPRVVTHTWVSPNTLGHESIVTVRFEAQGDATRMTLVHSGLPDHEVAHGHQRGWDYFLGVFGDQFGDGSRKPYRWEEAHPPTAHD